MNYKCRFLSVASFLIFLLMLILPSLLIAATMNSYCLIPPYVARQGVPPNITVVYEKGASIEIGAYYGNSYSNTTSYYGFFDSTSNYVYDTANNYFAKSATCTPTGTNNCLSGNILNYALMSSLDLSRKALVGFGWPDPGAGSSAGDVFTYSGNFCSSWSGSTCTSQNVTPVSYGQLQDGNTKYVAVENVLIGGSNYSYTFRVDKYTGSNPTNLNFIIVQPGATAPSGSVSCNAPCSTIISPGNSGQVAMKFTNENRKGLIQKYADKDINYQYDTNAPRFALKRWQSGAGGKQEDIIRDVPALTATEGATFFRNLISAISRAPGTDSTESSASSTPFLGDMMNEIVKYSKGNSSAYEDNDSLSQTPYDWANDPTKSCRKTFALFVTTGTYLGQNANKLSPLPPACASLTYTDAFPTNTCYAYNTDLYTTDGTPPRQNITTYVVHTTYYGAGAGNAANLTYAANISDGTYLKVDDPNKFEQVLDQAILDMLKRAASGTAASVLASGEGSGANLVQATFYPRTPKSPLGMFEKSIVWAGRLSNFWYYIDPFFSTSTILEDTNADAKLDLSDDKTVKLRYDNVNEYAVGDLYDYGSTTLFRTDIRLEFLKSLWDAGVQLWNRDVAVAANKRKIYTTINGTSYLSGNFSADANNGDSDNSSTLRPYFDLPTTDSDSDGFKDGDFNHDGVVDDNDARVLTRYIHGEDFPSYSWLRSRTTKIDLNGNGNTTDTVNGITEGTSNVWKLGDVLNSTPRISSWIRLNKYDQVYNDTTYGDFLNDVGSTLPSNSTARYKNRGMVFAGANDGMLHAFKLGKLELNWVGQTSSEKAQLTGTDLGKEMWAFIPKNVLPYLKYLTDTSYCHLYSVDLSPYIFDASINGNPGDTKTAGRWRTVLIGGMRLGGACKYSTSSCSGGGSDCVNSPVSNNGLSSYFALDVTDQDNPILLWEFSNENLGFSATSPSLVRIGADKTLNGNWFIVLGSGPTGPISTSDQQFLARSDQNLRLFVLDLKTGSLVRTIDTSIANAFAGSMLNVTHDTDQDYQDDVVYIPYVRKDAAAGTWTQGGVLRLSTKEDTSPNNWAVSTVMDGIGPVTSSVVKLQNDKKNTLWLYFGTGRYYFEQTAIVDDADGQRNLFGIKEPCFSSSGFDKNCTSSAAFASLTDVSSNPSADPSLIPAGWYINLDASGSYTYTEGSSNITRNYRAERVITDPLATTTGLVFFTTFKPYTDICAYGGKSFIWSLKYDSGGAPGALLKGIALLQVSTGSIEQIDLSSAFTQKNGRRTIALEGVPPTAQGLSILSTPPPLKRTIHIKER